MKITEIAAFGGLILGVINLLILLYKEFLKKGKLKAEIEKNEIIYLTDGEYFFQINMVLSAKNSDVQLRKIELSNPNHFLGESCWGETGSSQTLYYASPKTEESFCQEFKEAKLLKQKTEGLFSSKFEVQDLVIEKGKHRSLTFAGTLHTFSWPDGYQEMYLKDWSFDIYYLDKILRIPFRFIPFGKTGGNYMD